MSKPLMFGLAGEMLSGKSAAAKFLVEHFAVKELRMSKILDVLDLPLSRENQQTLARILREQFGDAILAKAVSEYAAEEKQHLFLIDGVRKIGELEELRKRTNFKLIYVKSPLEQRYERLKSRIEKIGEELKSLEAFQESHQAESEVDIHKLESRADFVIENTGDDSEMHAQLTRIFTGSL